MGVVDLIGPGRSLLYNLDEESCAPPDETESFALKYGFSTADLTQMTLVARKIVALSVSLPRSGAVCVPRHTPRSGEL
jgi:hypothetical protein|eukprot:COSAG02_NODE_3461_length_6697_cov_572.132161_4_plen_78_part_00